MDNKLTETAWAIRDYCAARHDCHGCPFATDELECKINGIPQLWGNETSDAPTDTPTDAPTATLDTPTRAKILDAAKTIVTGEREQQYGKPEDNFRLIGELWKIYLDNKYGTIIDIAAEDVALMMALMKIARITTGSYKEDNYVDLCGYAACAGEIAGR